MSAFPAKDPDEEYPLVFGLASFLKGETIVANPGPTITVTVEDGLDPAPQNILVGNPVIAGNDITQSVRGGLDNVSYELRLKFTTSAGKKYVATATLPVRRRGRA